jgi:hypothetical protein
MRGRTRRNGSVPILEFMPARLIVMPACSLRSHRLAHTVVLHVRDRRALISPPEMAGSLDGPSFPGALKRDLTGSWIRDAFVDGGLEVSTSKCRPRRSLTSLLLHPPFFGRVRARHSVMQHTAPVTFVIPRSSAAASAGSFFTFIAHHRNRRSFWCQRTCGPPHGSRILRPSHPDNAIRYRHDAPNVTFVAATLTNPVAVEGHRLGSAASLDGGVERHDGSVSRSAEPRRRSPDDLREGRSPATAIGRSAVPTKFPNEGGDVMGRGPLDAGLVLEGGGWSQ